METGKIVSLQRYADYPHRNAREREGKMLKQTVAKYAQSDAVLALGGGTVTLDTDGASPETLADEIIISVL